MKARKINIDLLKLDPNNSRIHDGRNLDEIGNSLQKFGQMTPIVVNGRGIVIKGNGTLEAAKRLGWKYIIGVVTTGLSQEQLDAYAIADNRTSDLSRFDFPVLSDSMKKLEKKDLQGSTGFNDIELVPLLKGDWSADELQEKEIKLKPNRVKFSSKQYKIILRICVKCYPNLKVEEAIFKLVRKGGSRA